jgi:hypothetical protein
MPKDGSRYEMPRDGQRHAMPKDGSMYEMPRDGQRHAMPKDVANVSRKMLWRYEREQR